MIRTTTLDSSTGGDGTIVGASGTRLPLNGEERKNGSVKEKDAKPAETKQGFVTIALKSVNHSTIHRTRTRWKRKENSKDRVPRKLGPADKTIDIREEGTTVQLCGENEVAEKWINGQHAVGNTEKTWTQSKDATLMVEKKNRTSCLKDRRLCETQVQKGRGKLSLIR